MRRNNIIIIRLSFRDSVVEDLMFKDFCEILKRRMFRKFQEISILSVLIMVWVLCTHHNVNVIIITDVGKEFIEEQNEIE